MHYVNGREAKAGDLVVSLEDGKAGVLYAPQASATTCNGRLATTAGHDPYITVGKCLHIDDVRATAETIPVSAQKS